MPNGPKGHANPRAYARFRVDFIHRVRKFARRLHLSLLIQTFPNSFSSIFPMPHPHRSPVRISSWVLTAHSEQVAEFGELREAVARDFRAQILFQ